jgi:hypothetical protein
VWSSISNKKKNSCSLVIPVDRVVDKKRIIGGPRRRRRRRGTRGRRPPPPPKKINVNVEL